MLCCAHLFGFGHPNSSMVGVGALCLEIDCHVFVDAVSMLPMQQCRQVSSRRDNVSYSEAKREKSLKGLPNYNLEINPVYIEKFALDVVSAHRFVRRIGKPAKNYKAMGRQNYRGRRQKFGSGKFGKGDGRIEGN